MDNEKVAAQTPAQSDNKTSKPSDEHFADTQTDIDPRTSNEGMTSIGGYDVNADSLPAETPGVRHEAGEDIESTSASVNTDLEGDIMNPGV